MYDLGIIGGGPAGYTAALHATSNGKKVVLFEQDKVGGTCLNRGCIPTKAILHSAEVFEEMKNADGRYFIGTLRRDSYRNGCISFVIEDII